MPIIKVLKPIKRGERQEGEVEFFNFSLMAFHYNSVVYWSAVWCRPVALKCFVLEGSVVVLTQRSQRTDRSSLMECATVSYTCVWAGLVAAEREESAWIQDDCRHVSN